MNDPIQTTALSMAAIGDRYETTAHNLANSSTVGYKRRGSAAMIAEATTAGSGKAASESRTSDGSGKLATKSFIDFSQGALIQTGRSLDAALHGPGFYVLDTPQGELYTRDGVFRTNSTGQLVDSEGRTVQGDGGPLTIPNVASSLSVNIGTDGRIMVGNQTVGKLRVVEFQNTAALTPVGQNAFRASAQAEPAAATKTQVQQGFQEASNVSPVEELVNLITCTRMYEATLKNITVQEEKMKNMMQVAMA
jgi:flagellar basal-body rod protein FlgF